MVPLLWSRRFRPELNPHQPAGWSLSKTIAALIQWAGYPIAIYSISVFEKQITETASLRAELGAFEMAVQRGDVVKDVGCLSAGAWKHVPWGLLRG